MAARALTIRNLLTLFVPVTTAAGMGRRLATMDIARNPKINHGNILESLKLAFRSPPSALLAIASFLLILSWMSEKVTTVGMMASVLVSFTMVAKSPAASEYA